MKQTRILYVIVSLILSRAATLGAQDSGDPYASGLINPSGAPVQVVDQVNLFTGSFTASVSLASISTRGGLSFPVNILYNSNISKIREEKNHESQASVVGLGWQLRIPAIVAEPHYDYTGGVYFENIWYLSGGGSNKIIKTPSGFIAQDYKFWKITSNPSEEEWDIDSWEIIDENGVTYTFENVCHRVFRMYYIQALNCSPHPNGTYWAFLRDDSYEIVPYRWNLTKITDTFGNSISLSYLDPEATGNEDMIEKVSDYEWNDYPNGCPDEKNGYATYQKAFYVDKVKDDVTGRVVKFEWESRSDCQDDIDGDFNLGGNFTDSNSDGDTHQEFIFERRLKSVKIYDKDPDVYSDEQCLKQVSLGYDYDNYYSGAPEERDKLQLVSIQEHNPKDANDTLPATKLDYTASGSLYNEGALSKITYPSGGYKEIIYKPATMYAVDKVKTSDGMNPVVETVYVFVDGLSYNDDAFYGFDYAQVKISGHGETRHYHVNPGNPDNPYLGLPTLIEVYENGAYVTPIAKTINTWYPKSKGYISYHKQLKSVVSIQDEVPVQTLFEYNEDNGLPSQITETNSDGTVRLTKTIYAFEVYNNGSSDMEDLHILTPVTQQTVYETSESSSNARSSTVTTWKEWIAGKWAPETTYNWLESSSSSYSLPSFNYTSPPGDSEWHETSRILDVAATGSVLEAQDANGVVTSTKWGYSSALPMATFVNAEDSETLVDDFNDANLTGDPLTWSTTGSYWTVSDGAVHWNYAGSSSGNCYSSVGRDQSSFIAEFDIRLIDGYTSTDWAALHFRKSNASDTPFESGYVALLRENGKVDLYDITNGVISSYQLSSDASIWHHIRVVGNGNNIKIYADGELAADVNNSTYSGSYVGFYAYRAECQFDNFRFYPSDAIAASQAYDPSTLQPTESVDANGISLHSHYNGFGQLSYTTDDRKRVLSASSSYLSREGNSDVFNSSDPNFRTTMSYGDADGYHDFQTSQGWSVVGGDITFGFQMAGETTVKMGTSGGLNGIYKSSSSGNLITRVDFYPDNSTGGLPLVLEIDGGDYRFCVQYVPSSDQFRMLTQIDGGSITYPYDFDLDGSPNRWYTVEIEKTLDGRCTAWVYPRGEGPNHTDVYSVAGFPTEWDPFVTSWSDDDYFYLANHYVGSFSQSTTFTDGLGRSLQSHIRIGSEDIVSHSEYNSVGKIAKQYHPQQLTNSDHGFVTSVTGNYESFEYFTDPFLRMKKQVHPDATYIEYAYEPDESESSGYIEYTSCTAAIPDDGWIDVKDGSGLEIMNPAAYIWFNDGANYEVLYEGTHWFADDDEQTTAWSIAAAIESNSTLAGMVVVTNIENLGAYRISLEEYFDPEDNVTIYVGTNASSDDLETVAYLTGGSAEGCSGSSVSEGYARKFLKVTDEEGTTSRRQVDKFGRSVQSKGALGAGDELTSGQLYDLLGNATKVLPPNYYDPRSGTSAGHWDDDTTKYNTLGQTREVYTTDEGLTRYVFDDAGNLRYSQNAYQAENDDDFTVYYYDVFGRVTHIGEEKDDFDWTTTAPSITNTTYGTEANEWRIKHSYDTTYISSVPDHGAGRLTKTEVNDDSDDTAEHTIRYVYDKYGNLTEKHIQIDGGSPLSEKVVRHSYDLLGRETELIYPSGNAVLYEYDEAGRLHKIYNQ